MTTVDAARAMIDSCPTPATIDHDLLAEVLAAAVACAQACTACADACLSEESVADLTRCIRTDLDCADVCTATSAVLARRTAFNVEVAGAILRACVVACRACDQVCAEHADEHEHCRLCAEACRRCEQACARLLDFIA